MDQDSEGEALLKSIKIKGFESAQNNDWDDVRNLGIDLLKYVSRAGNKHVIPTQNHLWYRPD